MTIQEYLDERGIPRKSSGYTYLYDMIDECIPDDIHEHEDKSAMKLASHKFKAGTDPRNIMQYLYMKGFGYDISQNVTEDITADWNCDEEYE